MHYCWTTLHVRDMEASLKFYQEVVQLPLSRRFPAGPGREIAFLGAEATQVELISDLDCQEVAFGASISLGFRVDDLDAKLHEMASRGIQVHSGPFQPNPLIRFFYIQDPDGLLVQFVEEKPALNN